MVNISGYSLWTTIPDDPNEQRPFVTIDYVKQVVEKACPHCSFRYLKTFDATVIFYKFL